MRYSADAVEVEIADRGGGAHDDAAGGAATASSGMRERVRMYGGELHAGRGRGGGFEVRARLPLEGEAAGADAGAT